jgi:hypothetical protein
VLLALLAGDYLKAESGHRRSPGVPVHFSGEVVELVGNELRRSGNERKRLRR